MTSGISVFLSYFLREAQKLVRICEEEIDTTVAADFKAIEAFFRGLDSKRSWQEPSS